MSANKSSFRWQLTKYGIIIFLIAAIPMLTDKIQQPWQMLNNLIEKSKNVIAAVSAFTDQSELEQINQIAMTMPEISEEDQKYYFWTFNWIIGGHNFVLTEQGIKKVLEENKQPTEFDYDKVIRAAGFWDNLFITQPKAKEIFQRYKASLIRLKENMNESGFEYDDAYLMTDNGSRLVFLIDGGNWYESTYPGMGYDVVENDCEYFIDYRRQGPGYYNNPLHYHLGIFPKFDSDEWGSWFSVWKWNLNGTLANNIAVDFRADDVKKQMWLIFGWLIFGTTLIVLTVIFLSRYLSRKISQPISDLIIGAESIIAEDYDHEVPVTEDNEIAKLIEVFNRMTRGLKERLNLFSAMIKLLPKPIVEMIMARGLKRGLEKKSVTIMFTDFAGFSTITQRLTDEEISRLLEVYWDALCPIVDKYKGYIDKFIGDSIMAMFGAPVEVRNHAVTAIHCAYEMQTKMREINKMRLAENLPIFEMRVGLSTGEVLVGAIGSPNRVDYTSIGEATNLGNRMESASQIGHILISETTYQLMQSWKMPEGMMIDEKVNHVKVKGYSDLVPGRNIWVGNFTIEKDPNSTSFYKYSER